MGKLLHLEVTGYESEKTDYVYTLHKVFFKFMETSIIINIVTLEDKYIHSFGGIVCNTDTPKELFPLYHRVKKGVNTFTVVAANEKQIEFRQRIVREVLAIGSLNMPKCKYIKVELP